MRRFRAVAINEACETFQFHFCNPNWYDIQNVAKKALDVIVNNDIEHQKYGPWYVKDIDVAPTLNEPSVVPVETVRVECGPITVVPKRDLPTGITVGFLTLIDGENCMPGATWSHTQDEALMLGHVYLAADRDADKFWHLLRAIQLMKKSS